MNRITLILIFALAGCGYHMTPQTFAAAVELCAPHGGLVGADKSTSRDYFWVTAVCKNGVEATVRVERED